MEYDVGVRLDAIIENQDKQFKIEQYKINLLESIAKALKIKISEVKEDGIQSNK